ncbi:MAG: ankyrin repeat domain-containing protein [Pseudomonadota bacterium]|nr:ankyrin repeat domain-containing protein [Pseudomonadota bacterium]
MILLMVVGMASCASVGEDVVPEALKETPISGLLMTCDSPYQLTQDCSATTGASRRIVLDGIEARIAGSKDGKHVFLMNAPPGGMDFLVTQYDTELSNSVYYALQRVLRNHGMKIERVVPVGNLGKAVGYLLEVDGDAYSILLTAGRKQEERSFDQVIYDDCMLVQVKEFKKNGKDKPEMVAHYVCKVISGICRDNAGGNGEECRKGTAAYIYIKDREGYGPSGLYKAAEAGNTLLVKKLLEVGYDPNANLGGPGLTPLMISAAVNNPESVAVLIKSGANVNARNKLGRTSLILASKYGFVPIVKLLLDAGADPDIRPNDMEGHTALIAASKQGYSEVVQVLLAQGANVNAPDKMGITAMGIAKKQGHAEIIRILSQAGAVE